MVKRRGFYGDVRSRPAPDRARPTEEHIEELKEIEMESEDQIVETEERIERDRVTYGAEVVVAMEGLPDGRRFETTRRSVTVETSVRDNERGFPERTVARAREIVHAALRREMREIHGKTKANRFGV